jgi:two-component system response regulator CpxR
MTMHGTSQAAGSTASRTTPTRVLLIDDDLELAEAMRAYFARHQIQLDAVADGRPGLARALGNEHDLILLDVMMPGLDGFELLRLLRTRSQTPVIMLTARTNRADRVLGLDAGADDYLPKPFGPEELLARIRAVLRRAGPVARPAELLEVGGLRLIPTARLAEADGEPIALTSIEFDILDILMRSAGVIVTRESLTAAVYHRRASPFDRAIDMHVSNLRKKLGERGSRIRTVRGVGYLLGVGAEGGAG